jgi:hypothetical protein
MTKVEIPGVGKGLQYKVPATAYTTLHTLTRT